MARTKARPSYFSGWDHGMHKTGESTVNPPPVPERTNSAQGGRKRQKLNEDHEVVENEEPGLSAQLSNLQRQQQEILALVRTQNEQINALQRTVKSDNQESEVSNSTHAAASHSPALPVAKVGDMASVETDLYDATPQPESRRGLMSTQRRANNLPASRQPQERSTSRDDIEASGQGEDFEIDAARDISAPFDNNAEIFQVTKETITLYGGMRMPAAVEGLPQLQLKLPKQPNEEFSHKILQKILGGTQIGNGWWQRARGSAKRKTTDRVFPNVRSYLALNPDHEPLLPRAPGQHGCQISAFLQYRDEEEEEEEPNMPLFIRRGQGGFRYFGTYTEPRYSDRIGANEMLREVPDSVKLYWAKKLGDQPLNGKGRKNISTIKDAWPKIELGWWDKDLKKFVDYDPELEAEYGEPLKCPISDEEAEAVTEKAILEAFNAPDCDDSVPSMTLFYEYLQAVGYDHDFYRILVEKKRELERLGAI